MAELKTQKNDGDVHKFLEAVEDEKKREDCFKILEIMREATNSEPSMWGTSIIGFGSYDYTYASGRSGTFFLAGFSPRKQNLSLYIVSGFDNYGDLMSKLGKHKTGKSCLYIKRLSDIDEAVLKELVKQSAEHVAKTNA